MRLYSIEILPRGTNGWGSGELLFGDDITSIHAKNGSGKTPVVQSIVFCLGYPVTFRDDISAKCGTVRLKLVIKGQVYVIERAIDKEVFVTATESNGREFSFNNEKDYSNYLFELSGLTPPSLVSNGSLPTQPYMATTIPVFYLDQDYGYFSAYGFRTPFIRDQFAETVRFLFGFLPKNSFERKKDQIHLKDQIESIDRKIVAQQKIVEDLRSDIGSTDTKEDLHKRVESLKEQLGNLRAGTSQKADTDSVLNEMYSSKALSIQRTEREIEGLRDRVGGITRINGEILAEVDTLSLNEEARRIFTSFSEICASENCCLFERSSQVYAKNLLYLKDQIKDLDRNAEIAGKRLALLEHQLSEQKAELRSLGEGIQLNQKQNNISGLVDVVRRLTQELIESEKIRAQLEMLEKQNGIYVTLTLQRVEIQMKLDLLSSGGERDLDFSKFKVELKGQIVRWLDILKTKNVSRNVTIENNLKIDFGGESLDVIKGSTKIRIVLAIHAALLEMYLKDKSRSFRFLILDTPKQHEIHTDDLLRYINELKTLASSNDAQIVLSSTDFRYSCDVTDTEWAPPFSGSEQNMYLGTADASIHQN